MKIAKNKILIVEDEPSLGQTLQEFLVDKGHDCKLAESMYQAKSIFQQFHPQVVLMDIGLPDGNGIELAKNLREKRKDFVLLFLSALNDPEVKLSGLELGAEDYITKPFALKELTLRLERIMQYTQTTEDEYSFGPLKAWPKRFEVQDANGKIISLSQKECGILKLLIDAQSEVVSRDKIIDQIWGQDSFPSSRTVDNYIVKLRKWAETDPQKHMTISSVRGIGYKLEVRQSV